MEKQQHEYDQEQKYEVVKKPENSILRERFKINESKDDIANKAMTYNEFINKSIKR